jgi:hypothetical protein
MNAVTTWYHLADQSPEDLAGGRPVLVIDGARRGPLVNSTVISNAAPGYAADGSVLVSSSALGIHTGPAADADVLRHLSLLYRVPTAGWELLRRFEIPAALPAAPAPLNTRREVRLGDGRYLAGDHRDTPSIQGALVSGRRAAQALLADLAK